MWLRPASNRLRWWIPALIWLLAGIGVTTSSAQDQVPLMDEPPALNGPAEPNPSEPPAGELPPPPPAADAATEEKAPADMDDEGVEVLTRGPVHEAFAEPIGADPEAGVIVEQQPPESIEEVPPDMKPEGDQVAWIPGYWAWDDDRNDFVWVSGIWRNPPPGQRWVPGYWSPTDAGWQWVSGFWAPVQANELTYREPPPETLEAGPNSPSPGEQYFWVPGTWTWYETSYRWRPGFWSRYQTDWVWVPAHWIWTPRGCLFLPGYWDYRVTRRGYLFAPVYFHAAYRARPSWYYTPRCVLDVGPLLVHFWIRPSYCHYYFGDYYSSLYASHGFTPWCQWHSHGSRFDPLLTYAQVYHQNRYRVDYAHRMQQWHTYYQTREQERPRHTFREQAQLAAAIEPSIPIQQSLLAQRLDEVAAKRATGPQRLVALSQDKRNTLLADAQSLRQLTQQRSKIERTGTVMAETRDRPSPTMGKPGTGRFDLPDRKSLGRPDATDMAAPALRDRTKPPETGRGSLQLPKIKASAAEQAGLNPGRTGRTEPGPAAIKREVPTGREATRGQPDIRLPLDGRFPARSDSLDRAGDSQSPRGTGIKLREPSPLSKQLPLPKSPQTPPSRSNPLPLPKTSASPLPRSNPLPLPKTNASPLPRSNALPSPRSGGSAAIGPARTTPSFPRPDAGGSRRGATTQTISPSLAPRSIQPRASSSTPRSAGTRTSAPRGGISRPPTGSRGSGFSSGSPSFNSGRGRNRD